MNPCFCLISIVCGAVGETVFLLWTLHGGFLTMTGSQAFALHGGASIALVFGAQQSIKCQLVPDFARSPALFWFLLPVNLAMPGAALLILLAAVGNRPLPKTARSRVSIYQPIALNERDGNPAAHEVASRQMRQSILEILQQTEGPGRAHAILALKDVDPVHAMPLLRRALQDSDELVRIYAQNLLNRIVERVEESTRQLERQLATRRSPSCLVRLAEQYHELVYLGVVAEPEGCRSLIEKALGLLEEAIALQPRTPHLHLLALKYSLRNRDLSRSRRHLAKAEAIPGCAREQLLALKGELAFVQKDWDALRSLLEEVRPTASGPMAAICEFYIGSRT